VRRIISMSEQREKALEKVNKEFKKVSEAIAEIHVAFRALKDAGPTDDLYELLEDLENRVHKARTGGLTGSGAKSHRKALADYQKLLEPPAGG
jgi:Skp family chaperone for outer membrane proteins